MIRDTCSSKMLRELYNGSTRCSVSLKKLSQTLLNRTIQVRPYRCSRWDRFMRVGTSNWVYIHFHCRYFLMFTYWIFLLGWQKGSLLCRGCSCCHGPVQAGRGPVGKAQEFKHWPYLKPQRRPWALHAGPVLARQHNGLQPMRPRVRIMMTTSMKCCLMLFKPCLNMLSQ